MKKFLSLLVLGLSLTAGVAYADPAADCAAKSAEKKLAGAAKASFEKKCVADDKKLHGAARTSNLKKCMADEQAAAKK